MSAAGQLQIPLPQSDEGAPAPSFLAVSRLTKKFGSTVVVDDVSLEIGSGEFVCVLGPSGCGKTTLLRLIAGFEAADAGSIHQAGQDVTRLPPEARDFGIVFQSYALFPNRTVDRNVAFGLEALGVDRAARAGRVDELLALVGLADHARKFPSQLSGGQQQRVALARALALSPGLLLLDEPLSALDANVRANLRDELRALQRRVGVTTLMVTHDQQEALSIADRLVVMNSGRIEQIGTPIELYQRPANLFVARFLGEMNALPIQRLLDSEAVAGGMTFHLGAPPTARAQARNLCFRPAAISIGADRDGARNAFAARITAVGFLGDTIRVSLAPEAAPDTSLVADVPLARLGAMPVPGETVTAAIAARHLMLLDGQS